MNKSVYIHIPFCQSICSYCDFAKVYYNEELVDKYLIALEDEIKQYNKEEVNTLYFGGGTPSSLNITQLNKLFSITKIFNLVNTEVTFECNIENITEEKLKILKENNINRISIGIQTFNKKHLKFLKRNHTLEEVKTKLNIVKKYFKNINVDLMYGFPNQTLEELEKDIEEFKKLDIPHISTYSLIIEPHTMIYDKVKNIDEDLDYLMYKTIIEKLNFNHYETSNFSKPGFESHHNLTYWNNLEYYGFGCGASGFINNIRYDNTRNLFDYIKGNYRKDEEIMTYETNLQNEFILGFRKTEGINIKKINEKYNINVEELEMVKKLIQEEKLEIINNYLKITEKYIYLANDILVEFI